MKGCEDADAAVAIIRSEVLDAVIVHRAADVDGATLTKLLRDSNPQVMIVMVSGFDRAKEARDAGATTFLSYDEWLRVGTVVADELKARESKP